MAIYWRTCQECGHVQQDVDPDSIAESRKDAYMNRKCKRCKSEALDYGSIRNPNLPTAVEEEE